MNNEQKKNNEDLEILRKISKSPDLSQRELSKELGFSLGKLNYCLKSLQKKGLIKINNFKKNNRKAKRDMHSTANKDYCLPTVSAQYCCW